MTFSLDCELRDNSLKEDQDPSLDTGVEVEVFTL